MRDALEAARVEVQAALDDLLGPRDGEVAAAMRYAVAGGKRVRGFLALEAASLFGVPRSRAVRAACAIECVHAYSLVHDDLPAMDDDDLRRGQPTVHVRWDEATAVLAGDALQTVAFETLADPATHPDGAVRADLCLWLARDAGGRGMVRGQELDIAAETGGLADEAGIVEIQRLKTGRLLEWPCRAGALLGGADPAPLVAYAEAVGLAFQIKDDLLDVEGDAALVGKAVAKDAAAGKATFVDLLGAEGARARAVSLVEQAKLSLLPYGDAAANLAAMADYIVHRDR
ncbi:polyprenyl synthetase family protein [Jannaschia sp. Os4]|uniref:polyprenyl synthetase family protein n=1 Tax=Jannaschia sp. Os4 TaxID=2807617 RepID=UPI0019398D47|nr:farnesyl diphosphate synthase [Jannaschia sp. Os4]MBM2575405.1 polyprenyl synthetase family protein [Jannaschia sp. Os4]